MPCYPAMALLLGSAMAAGGAWVKRGTRALTVVTGVVALALFAILIWVRHVPTPGDIASALTRHPSAYTLSLGHMEDLTLDSFAYLRVPLLLAAIAFAIGCLGTLWRSGRAGRAARAAGNAGHTGQPAFLAAALMMVLFFQAARLAMVTFDPYMGSRPLAEALLRSPDGELIVDHFYYTFASVFFYTDRTALMLNGRKLNFEYGANAPDAPHVFIDDAQFKQLWLQPARYYVVTQETDMPRFQKLVGAATLNVVAESGGKLLMTNHPVPAAPPAPSIGARLSTTRATTRASTGARATMTPRTITIARAIATAQPITTARATT